MIWKGTWNIQSQEIWFGVMLEKRQYPQRSIGTQSKQRRPSNVSGKPSAYLNGSKAVGATDGDD